MTFAVIVGALVVLIAYDVYAAVRQAPGQTISEVIWHASLKRPVIPFAAGVLCGHWFWQMGVV